MKISSLISNWQSLDGGAMFGHVPKPMWSKWYEPDELGRVRLACRCLLVEHNDKKYLFEAGIGSYMNPKMRGIYGVESDRNLLLDALSELSIKPDEIDAVILSHLHFDHAGGLLPSFDDIEAKGNRLVFSNARYYVGKTAFERAKKPHFRDKASFIPGLVELLEDSNRLTLVEEGDSLFGFCNFIFTNGHTPGQMHSLIKSDHSKILFTADLIPGTPWVHLPVSMGYDRCAETIVDEKKDVLDRAIDGNWCFFYTHDPDFAMSKVLKNDKGRYSAEALEKDFTRKNL